MTTQAGDVTVSIRADGSEFYSGITTAKAAVDKFDKSANKAAGAGAKKLGDAGKTGSRAMDKFGASIGNATNKASQLPGPLGGIAARAGSASAAIGAVGIAATVAAAAIGVLVLGLGAAIREAEEWERASLKTNAILKATGSAAGLTAHQLEELANEIKRTTLASEASVIAASQKLLTFRSVQGDTFREALRLSQDLAAVGFGSVESAATQLGKALEDPVNGLAALKRVGVSFSVTQKEQIKNFIETGRVAEAQTVILAALRQQVGGAGTAEAGGLSGAYHRLSENSADFLENIGKSGPLQAATLAVNALANAIEFLNDQLFEADRGTDIMQALGQSL
jgi:hypothetical protein